MSTANPGSGSRTELAVSTVTRATDFHIDEQEFRIFNASPERLDPFRTLVSAELLSGEDTGKVSSRTSPEHSNAVRLHEINTSNTHAAVQERVVMGQYAPKFQPLVYKNSNDTIDVKISVATHAEDRRGRDVEGLRAGPRPRKDDRVVTLPLNFPVDMGDVDIDRSAINHINEEIFKKKARIVIPPVGPEELYLAPHFLGRVKDRSDGEGPGIMLASFESFIRTGVTIDRRPSSYGRTINGGPNTKRVWDITDDVRKSGVGRNHIVNFREYELRFELSIEVFNSIAPTGGAAGKFAFRGVFSRPGTTFSFAVVFVTDVMVTVTTKLLTVEVSSDDTGSKLLQAVTFIDNGGDSVIRVTVEGEAADPEGSSRFSAPDVEFGRFPGGARLLRLDGSRASQATVERIMALKQPVDTYTGVPRAKSSARAAIISKTGVERPRRLAAGVGVSLIGEFLYESSMLYHVACRMERSGSAVRGFPGFSRMVYNERNAFEIVPDYSWLPGPYQFVPGSPASPHKKRGCGGVLLRTRAGKTSSMIKVPFGGFAKVEFSDFLEGGLGGVLLGDPSPRFVDSNVDVVTKVVDGVRLLEEPVKAVLLEMVPVSADQRAVVKLIATLNRPWDGLPLSFKEFVLLKANFARRTRLSTADFFGDPQEPHSFTTDHKRAVYAVNGRDIMTRVMMNRCFVGQAYASEYVGRISKEAIRAHKTAFAVRLFPPGVNASGQIPIFTVASQHARLFRSGEVIGTDKGKIFAGDFITSSSKSISNSGKVSVVGYTNAYLFTPKENRPRRGMFIRGVNITPTITEAIRVIIAMFKSRERGITFGTPLMIEVLSTPILILVKSRDGVISTPIHVAVSGAHRSSCWTTTNPDTATASRAEVMARMSPCES